MWDTRVQCRRALLKLNVSELKIFISLLVNQSKPSSFLDYHVFKTTFPFSDPHFLFSFVGINSPQCESSINSHSLVPLSNGYIALSSLLPVSDALNLSNLAQINKPYSLFSLCSLLMIGMKHFMQPRNTILRETHSCESPFSSSPNPN